MENLVKSLQERISSLRKEKQELEDKIVELLTRPTAEHLINLPDSFDLHNKILDLIDLAKEEVLIVTESFDQDFAHVIIKKWKQLQNKLLLITLDRHLIYNNDSIKGYDFLISTNTLEIINNPDIKSTFLILDRKQVLVLTTNLNKKDIIKKFNIGVLFNNERVAKKFFKFFNEHLPTFMQIS